MLSEKSRKHLLIHHLAQGSLYTESAEHADLQVQKGD